MQRDLCGLLLSFLVLLAAACGGGDGASEGNGRGIDARGSEAVAVPSQPAGVEPVVAGVIDAALAESGEGLFTAAGCTGCHTIGAGRLVGPDLLGVTDRRDPGWIQAMILRPDSMIQADETARELLAEYYTPMLPLGIAPEDARAILEFLRTRTEGDSSS